MAKRKPSFEQQLAQLERKFQRQLNEVIKAHNGGFGINAHFLYSKHQFLLAKGCGETWWQDQIRDPDFKAIVTYQSAKDPMIHGQDYIDYLKRKRVKECQTESGSDSSSPSEGNTGS